MLIIDILILLMWVVYGWWFIAVVYSC